MSGNCAFVKEVPEIFLRPPPFSFWEDTMKSQLSINQEVITYQTQSARALILEASYSP